MSRTAPALSEIDETDLELEDVQHHHRQRSARTDSSMRDGDSGHGNPGENPEDDFSIDNDVGDSEEDANHSPDLLEMIPDRHGADGVDPEADPGLLEDVEFDPTSPALTYRREVPPDTVLPIPIAGYDKLKIMDVVASASDLGTDELMEVIAYEESNRNRKTLLTRLNRQLRSRPSNNSETMKD